MYSTDAVAIRYEDFLALRRDGKVSLNIQDVVADTIGVSPQLQPVKTTAGAAFTFWNRVTLALIIVSVVLSFTYAWWCFLVGIGAGLAIVTANGRANQRNLLDAAMVDSEFYEKIRSVRGWEYRMHPYDAEPYLTESYREGRKAGEEYLRQKSVTK